MAASALATDPALVDPRRWSHYWRKGWSHNWRSDGPMLLAQLSSRWSHAAGGRQSSAETASSSSLGAANAGLCSDTLSMRTPQGTSRRRHTRAWDRLQSPDAMGTRKRVAVFSLKGGSPSEERVNRSARPVWKVAYSVMDELSPTPRSPFRDTVTLCCGGAAALSSLIPASR